MTVQEERLTDAAPKVSGARSSSPSPRKAARVEPDQQVGDDEDQVDDGTSDREPLDDDELFAMFRDSIQQSVLPDLPPLPGYHVCWLTTANPRDTIQRRLRMGYELIQVTELPGWQGVSLKTGDYAGVIAVNEMVAARIPLRLYNRYMHELHHAQPLSEEEKLRGRVDQMRQQAQSIGAKVEEGDGMSELVQRAQDMPAFSE